MRGWRGLLAGTMLAGQLVAGAAMAQTGAMTDNDPYIWLENKDGAKALAWVEAENAKTLPRLQNDPRYQTFYGEALAIASAKDRIPMPGQLYGRIVNFWRDADHPQGLWRYTTEADYASANPKWTTLLDLDALSKAEGKKWVWKGLTCLSPEDRLCLIALSEGGEDAIEYREFDMETGQFVPGGFRMSTSKQGASWLDKDTLLVSRDWGQGTLTKSSYPFVVKMVKRGQPLDQATEIYRGAPTDELGTYAGVLTDAQGHRAVVIERRKTFFGGDKLLWTPTGGAKPIAMPARAFPSGLVDGRVIFQTSDAWGEHPAGSVVWAPLSELEAGTITPRTLFTPTDRQAVEGVSTTKDRVVVTYIDNVRGRASVFAPTATGWSASAVQVPDNMAVDVVSTSDRSDIVYLSTAGFTTPTVLSRFDASRPAAPQVLKTLPARFDATGTTVHQYEATSTDGTKIPYFVVLPKGAKLDGTTPTLMTAYGGFEVARLPSYLGSTGKIWTERGGAYVLADIRGGGEFGPKWHDAGRKTKR